MLDRFPSEVADQLKWYVYRLVDPRNGQTFYVGKGKNDRVFQHAKDQLSANGDEDEINLKFQQIKAIRATGLEVAHIIHRHGIESETVAFQIEGAVMDAFPGLTNQIGGHGSGDYGVRHVFEIMTEYAAPEFIARHNIILISISKTFDDEAISIYDAARCCWIIDPERARQNELVLAHRRGLVVGVFRPARWMKATMANFPRLTQNEPRRWGFEGMEAEEEVANLYLRKRVPNSYRAKGAANPIRFISSEKTTPF